MDYWLRGRVKINQPSESRYIGVKINQPSESRYTGHDSCTGTTDVRLEFHLPNYAENGGSTTDSIP